jgi:hypothetical protein
VSKSDDLPSIAHRRAQLIERFITPGQGVQIMVACDLLAGVPPHAVYHEATRSRGGLCAVPVPAANEEPIEWPSSLAAVNLPINRHRVWVVEMDKVLDLVRRCAVGSEEDRRAKTDELEAAWTRLLLEQDGSIRFSAKSLTFAYQQQIADLVFRGSVLLKILKKGGR